MLAGVALVDGQGQPVCVGAAVWVGRGVDVGGTFVLVGVGDGVDTGTVGVFVGVTPFRGVDVAVGVCVAVGVACGDGVGLGIFTPGGTDTLPHFLWTKISFKPSERSFLKVTRQNGSLV